MSTHLNVLWCSIIEIYFNHRHHSSVMTRDPTAYVIAPAEHYLVPTEPVHDLVDLLLGSRTQSLERSASRVAELIEQRIQIRDDALESIEENRLTVRNLVHALYRSGQPSTDNPLYVRLRLEELRLDRDSRQELAACWKDTVDVGKELAQVVEQIETARRNQNLIQGDDE